MDPKVLTKINEARLNRIACVHVTNLVDGRDRVVVAGNNVSGELGNAIDKSFKSGKSQTVEISGEEFFINVHLPAPRIVVIGAVHISQALSKICEIADFDLEVIDPRTAFASQQRFGDTRLFADWPEDVLKQYPLDAHCALVAVTHDPKIDDYPIKAALDANCFYVGALGSRKTHAKRIGRLAQSGVSQDDLAKIHSPIGLDIGAATPQEIAVAIMAEIIDVLRKREFSEG